MLDAIIHRKRSAIYIAEIGMNHNGDMETARAMIRAAAGAGADAVKFQTFVPELMNSAYTADLLETGGERRRDTGLADFFRRFVFDREQYLGLKTAAGNAGVLFFSSVFDADSLSLMEAVGAPLYKLASSEVTNHPLLEAVAETGKPLILSTGISTEEEIDMAVSLFRRRSGAELVLLHCVSLYPTLPEQANLARIPALAARFGLPVGLSDHSRETVAPMLAAALGARIFEKHFTIDRFHECPDKDISCAPDEFARVVESVETAVAMIGSGTIAYGRAEAGTARAARRSLFARRSIAKGAVVAGEDLVALRPGVGIPVYGMKHIVGKRSRVDIPAGAIIKQEYFD